MSLPTWIEIGIQGDNITLIGDEFTRLLSEDEALVVAMVLMARIIEVRRNRRVK